MKYPYGCRFLSMQGLEVNLFDSVPSSCFSDLQQNIKHIYIYHRIKAVGFRLATWSVSFNRTLFQTVAARCALTKSKNRFFQIFQQGHIPYIYIYIPQDKGCRSQVSDLDCHLQTHVIPNSSSPMCINTIVVIPNKLHKLLSLVFYKG